MSNIYDQHKASFSQVSAFVICYGAEKVATIAFKFPRDGAGRLLAYVHWLGVPMVRGHAGGYGYDKKSAAVESAIEKLKKDNDFVTKNKVFGPGADEFTELCRALGDCKGDDWQRALENAGFTVFQAV